MLKSFRVHAPAPQPIRVYLRNFNSTKFNERKSQMNVENIYTELPRQRHHIYTSGNCDNLVLNTKDANGPPATRRICRLRSMALFYLKLSFGWDVTPSIDAIWELIKRFVCARRANEVKMLVSHSWIVITLFGTSGVKAMMAAANNGYRTIDLNWSRLCVSVVCESMQLQKGECRMNGKTSPLNPND